MNVKKHLFALGLVAALASPAMAAEDIAPPSADGPFGITGSLALTSEYFFRGLSQSNDKPAIQGGLNANYDLGFATASAGVWASNIDFGAGGDESIEVDFLAGLSGTYEGVTWNVGGVYYAYPGVDESLNYNYWEAVLGAGYDFGVAVIGVSYAYSPEFFGDSGDAHYINGKVTVPFKYVDLIGSVGRQYIDENATFGTPDYTDWKVAAAAKLYGLDLELALIDTTLDDTRYAAAADTQILFTVTKNF